MPLGRYIESNEYVYVGPEPPEVAGYVSSVSYNPANQMLTMTYSGLVETRTYNSLNQLTNILVQQGASTLVNRIYNYTAEANIGKIASQSDTVSGETVQYLYDSLNRLTSASASSWSQTFSYDPFGNLMAKTATGTAPNIPTNAEPTRYDANAATLPQLMGAATLMTSKTA